MARTTPFGKAQEGLRQYGDRLRKERASLVTHLQEIESKIDAVEKAMVALANGSNGRSNRGAVSPGGMKPEHVRGKATPKKARQRGVGQKVTQMLEARGKATAADIAKTLGINSGSIQYALRTLEDKGTIRQTGKMVGRTREYEFVGTGRIAEPGSADA